MNAMPDTLVIDRACGFGKSTDLINWLKTQVASSEKYLLVVPELGEVNRFETALQCVNFKSPIVNHKLIKNGGANNKTGVFIDFLSKGRNIIITHSLFEGINKFQNLLSGYNVIIDEVPTVVKQVPTLFREGIFKNLLIEKGYINIDPDTQLITAATNWFIDEHEYQEGLDRDISRFMTKIQSTDVYYVRGAYCVMPLPDAFFTKPKSLTILTFLFKGTQLDYYMRKRKYAYTVEIHLDDLELFKQQMNANLKIFKKTLDIKTGFSVMTSKPPLNRRKVGNFIKNAIQNLNKAGLNFTADTILVACSKDAWFGTDENKQSNVSNATRLKTLTRLTDAAYTAMITRGTNKFKDRNVLIMMGKVNINPGLAAFLNMETKRAKDRHTLSELIQLIYRTSIRDGKETFFITPDKENIRLLEEFMMESIC